MLLYIDMRSSKSKKQFALFCLVGLINTVIDLSLYLILHQILGIPTYIASPLVILVVMSISYILNAKLVFFSTPNTNQYLKFMLFTGVGVIVVQTSISFIFERHAQNLLIGLNFFKNEELDVFLANSIIRIFGVVFSITWNFLFYKYVIFKIEKSRNTETITDSP